MMNFCSTYFVVGIKIFIFEVLNHLNIIFMKSKQLFLCLLLCISSFLNMVTSQAQTKVAIVSAADTAFIHQHLGVTIFANFTDTLPINYSIVNYLEKKIQFYLNENYSISVVQLPDSILKLKNGFFSSAKTKKVKQWIKSNNDLYDFVIVLENMTLPNDYGLIPKNTSGIYSKSAMFRSKPFSAYYSSITFYVYRSSDLKPIEYYNGGGELFLPIKNFNVPTEKNGFTPQMLDSIYEGFKSYMDSRVEYFLAKAYLLPQDKINAKKAQSSTAK